MSVEFASGFTGIAYGPDNPRIGWRRISGALSATSGEAGYAAANAATDRTDSFYKPSAYPATWKIDAGSGVAVSYCGIAAHTLGSRGCTVEVFSSTDDVTFTTRCTHAPNDDGAILMLFPEVTARYWAVYVTGTGATPLMGHIRFGRITEFPLKALYTGIAFHDARQATANVNETEGGQWAGRSLRRVSLNPVMEVPDLSDTWINSEYRPFARAAQTEPFFVADRPQGFPRSVAYAWSVNPNIPPERTRALAAASTTVRLDLKGFAG